MAAQGIQCDYCHSLPTGVGDLRQVWLEVKIQDAKGTPLYQAGIPDKNSELPPDTLIFKTTLGDGKGNPVLNLLPPPKMGPLPIVEMAQASHVVGKS